ncbi:MAG: glycosyltransferase [Parabacteroides sp.]|nr:glycosyltransferase [Parabacteroides sp.]
MKNPPEISVIVPVYKVEAVLSKCIDSILNQSFDDFELLLIDDGSPDKSGLICDQYAACNDKIRVFHKKHGGVSSSRNLGLREAVGNYIIFIDSDDWVDSDFFLTLSHYMKDYDIIFFGLNRVSVEGKVLDSYLPESNSSDNTSLSDIVYSLFDIGLLGYMCSMAVKREVITKNNIEFREDISIHEDSIFCYSCLGHVEKAVVLNYLPYMYVIYTDQRETLSHCTPGNYHDIAKERIHIMAQMLKSIDMPEDKANIIHDTLKYWTYMRCMDWAFVQSDPVSAIEICFVNLQDLENFKVQKSLKSLVFKLAIILKSPYLMLLGKKLAKKANSFKSLF